MKQVVTMLLVVCKQNKLDRLAGKYCVLGQAEKNKPPQVVLEMLYWRAGLLFREMEFLNRGSTAT
jgi:hypothetical protein